MDRTTHQRFARPTSSSRRRSAFAATAQLCTATAACALWIESCIAGTRVDSGNRQQRECECFDLVAVRAARHQRREQPVDTRIGTCSHCVRSDSTQTTRCCRPIFCAFRLERIMHLCSRNSTSVCARSATTAPTHTSPPSPTGVLPQTPTPPTETPGATTPTPDASVTEPDAGAHSGHPETSRA